MDNDLKLVKSIKKIVKKMKFRYDYRDIDLLSEKQGNILIKELLEKDDPLMVARGGATEMRCIGEYLVKGFFSDKIKREIRMLSGVFPTDDKTLADFCECYIKSIQNANVISLWGVGAESTVIHKYCRDCLFTELHALEPYYFEEPWSEKLFEKRILVIHPFVDSIKMQYARREKLFIDGNVLPEFKSLECVKAVQSIAGEKTRFNSWFEALEYMEKEIDEIDFDIAIIGAGAYGLPLASYCKKIGKKAIQMSGATQILFGIKGKRWDNLPEISKFYNQYWIRPNISETPSKKNNVEGGSYW